MYGNGTKLYAAYSNQRYFGSADRSCIPICIPISIYIPGMYSGVHNRMVLQI